MSALIAFTTLPDLQTAVKLADDLVNAHCAACVHILPAGQSVYRWMGKVEHAEEVTLLIKTTDAKYPLLEKRIMETHPYDLPELIAVPASGGLPGYLEWISRETE
jgi:periplasmic divalent cation tolerance protein